MSFGFILCVFFLGMVVLLHQKNTLPDSVTPNKQKLHVSATIFPIYDLVRTIAGPDIDTVLLLPPGASPHTFEFTPKIARAAQDSQALFMVHHDIDGWAQGIQIAPTGTYIDLSTSVSLKPFSLQEIELPDAQEEEENHDHDAGVDPHYWLNPENSRALVARITTVLAAIDPEHAENFEMRQKMFLDKLDQKELQWNEQIEKISGTQIVVMHDAFSYFADFAHIDIVGSFQPYPGKEPTPKYLKSLIDIVNAQDVAGIFIEPAFARASAESFSKDVHVPIGILDPIGGSDNIQTYFDLIDFNLNAIENI